MCGIYVSNLLIEEKKLRHKLESIKFRGPDYTGITQKDDLSFGHLRLSIIDLDERSNQPYEYDNLTLVFNGEIYNFLEIKSELEALGHTFNTSSDTEVLIKGFKQWGEDVVYKLNGMFAFAIYDSLKKILFCSRDRLGVKPFYYSWKDGAFEICSQLQPISNNKSLNKSAIGMYLDCKFIPSPFTIYEDVYKLPPGNNLIIDLKKKSYELKEYWNLKKVKTSKISYKESVNKLHELLKDAVRIRLNSDVPIGTFLSGGVDSALVTSIAAEVSNDKVKTFTIGFDNPNYDESKVAQSYADRLKTDHKVTICNPEEIIDLIPTFFEAYDEPFGDSSALPSLLLNQVTKKDITVALSGDGGDESFLGYNHFDLVSKYKPIFFLPFFIRKVISKILPKTFFGKNLDHFKNTISLNSINNIIEGVFVGFNSIAMPRNLNWLKHYSIFSLLSNNILQKCADLNIKLWLENDSNVKVDRASMAHSVEVRSPFLDYRIIEFARQLPVSYRYSSEKNQRKKILRDILENYIPKEMFTQPKSGFSIPLGGWIKNELSQEFDSNLSIDILNQIPNLNIKKFQSMYSDHFNNKADYSSYIWRVYVLSKWMQKNRFIKL
ncbi:MAG: asparagine synthase (glutamine-hydrolyzing) [Flavobacteriales bacterium]